MSNKPQVSIEDQLDAILDAEESQGQVNPLELHALIHERRRKRAHAKAKAVQPSMGVRDTPQHAALFRKVKEFLRTPLAADDADATAGAMDYLLQTLQDTIDATDFEDAVFASLRIVRKVWAWNQAHLGPIEGIPAKE